MSVFDSERARIEIGSFQQIATEQCRLGGAERIIVGYTNACFGAEKSDQVSFRHRKRSVATWQIR